MNLNANQLKVLAYIRPYLGEVLPGRQAAADDLGIPQSTLNSCLLALERHGAMELSPVDKALAPCQQKRVVLSLTEPGK